MTDSALYSSSGPANDHESTEDLWVLIGLLGTALAATVWPTGGGPAVVGGITFIAGLNIRSPDPWARGSSAWNDMSDHFTQVRDRMVTYRNDVDGYWRDRGAEAFVTFLQGHLEPALGAIADAAAGVRDMCDDMYWALVTSLASFIVTTAGALLGTAAAYASGPYTPATQWGIVAAWGAATVASIAAIVTLAQQIWASAKDLGDSLSDLTDMFREQGGRLDTAMLNLPEQVRTRISDPRDWVKE